MQTRYMQRTNSMARGKRSAEEEEEEEDQPERKRPALASVIVEALKVDSLQKLCSSLEPILRRVVSEEVERALAKFGPTRFDGRSSPRRIEGPDGSNLQLQFRSRLTLPLFTGGKVEGEQGAAIHVVLLDANTGHVITCGAESAAKLDVVVLEGDFNNEDEEDWAPELFESHVVKEREGKRPLLTGELQVMLKEGVGTLGELTFTDNSSWIRSRKFRLGLRVAPGYCDGVRVREAKTEAFTVKDHRGELYKKHYPPALNDEVWRLEKIGKDGSFHKRLSNHGIYTVEDFLRLVVRDAQKLRNILGSGMSNKMWDALLEHAKTCVLSGNLYVYYADDSRNVAVVFNNIFEFNGLISGDQYYSAISLSDDQKICVDTLVKKAYENWNHVVEYNGKSILSFKQSKKLRSSQSEFQLGQAEEMDHRLQLPHLPVMAAENSIIQTSSGGGPSQFMNSTQRAGFEHVSVENCGLTQMNRRNNGGSLAMAVNYQPSTASCYHSVAAAVQPPTSYVNHFDDWTNGRGRPMDELFSEEDIRIRSHEMLENEDMQHLLRLFSMGGQASANIPEDGYPFTPFMASPMPHFDADRSRSGKAVVGWLKIKAAMRWGFFIRKKAAERRAQIIELDE